MTFGSLFSGIGGLDLGLEWAGMECKWQVEIDEYCQKVLTKHWPDVPKFRDIRETGKRNLESVDLICGGFPCQPWSLAGKRRGTDDDRHLWPEMLRVIGELQPRYVLGENVPGIAPYLDTVLDDLEREGYQAVTLEIPAAAFDAPHLRYRIFIIAYACSERRQQDARGASCNESPDEGRAAAHDYELAGLCEDVADAEGQRCGEARGDSKREKKRLAGGCKTSNADEQPMGRPSVPRLECDHWSVEPDVGRVAYGISSRVDRLKGLGNAVVPQVAEWIGRRILEAL